jgi:hypothetical protein
MRKGGLCPTVSTNNPPYTYTLISIPMSLPITMDSKQQPCSIHTLPNEILARIFCILSSYTLYLVVPTVCTRWKTACLHLSNMPITFSSSYIPGVGFSTCHGVPTFGATHTNIATVMRRVHSISSVDDNSWTNHTTFIILTLLPSIAPTLVSFTLNNVFCQPTHCYIHRITALCANLRTLRVTGVCHDNCITAAPTDIRCTKLRSLLVDTPPPAWLQRVITITTLEVLVIDGTSRTLEDTPLVFKHPPAMHRLVTPYNLTIDRQTAFFANMHNLTDLTTSSRNWPHLIDILRRECPALQKMIIDEAHIFVERLDYTVFQTGFTRLRYLGVHEYYKLLNFTYTTAMFAPLNNLPALTHFVTDFHCYLLVASIALPTITCLCWSDEQHSIIQGWHT